MKFITEEKLQVLVLLLFLISLAPVLNAQSHWSQNPDSNNVIIALPNSKQSNPVIAKDGSNGAVIAWVDERNGNEDIYAQRIDGSGKLVWDTEGKRFVVDSEQRIQRFPAILEGTQGDVFMAWADTRNPSFDSEIWVQKFNKEGEPTWSTATISQAALEGNNRPPLLLNNEKNKDFPILVAAFNTDFQSNKITYQNVNDANGSKQFVIQKIVSNNASGVQPNQPPAVVLALNGGVIATWADTRPERAVIAKGVSPLGLGWGAGEVTVSTKLTSGTYPVAVSDGSQGAIIVWIEPVDTENDVIKASRLDALGSTVWSAQTSTSAGKKSNLKIAPDGQNGAFIVWEQTQGFGTRSFLQRIKGADGASWSQDVQLSTRDSGQILPAIINNGNSQAIVAWVDFANDITIYAQLIDSTGDTLWGEGGVAVTTAHKPLLVSPVLVDDGLGGAIIAWGDQPPGTFDIYAQRVNVKGTLGEFREILVTSPTSSDNWEIGSSQVIQWTASKEIANVSIELLRDNGAIIDTLASSLPNDPQNGQFTFDPVTGPASNSCQIRIRAVTPDFILNVSQVFTISDSIGPTLDPDEPAELGSYGESILVTANATDISGTKEVLLNFRKGGASNFDSVPMDSVAPNEFSGSIPSNSVTERGVEYFISSRDIIGVTSRSDAFFVPVAFDAGVEKTQIAGGSSENSYRMISAPNFLDETLADSVFTLSGFGAYDTTSWRLFQYRDNGYVERDSLNAATFKFEPGEAFWLISRETRDINFGSGISVRADANYTVTLKPGWNQVGLPFAFPVAWDSIFIASGSPDKVQIPWLHEGGYDPADILEPYKGYFIFNNNDSNINLRIPPVAFEGLTKPLARLNLPDSEWLFQIKASCEEARDEFNLLGINNLASDGWDRLDYAEPPPIGDYVSVYFPRNGWEINSNNYATDIRKQLAEGQTWSFDVTTNIRNSEVKLTLEGLESVPNTIEIFLLDEGLQVSKDLGSDNFYSFPTGAHGTTKSLKIVVGSSDYLSDEVSGIALVPVDFELSQNFPNPFNPVTVIRYGLPHTENVSIRIFDLLGREVRTLIDGEQKEAGYHTVSWNGQDKTGRPVASGVYIYRFESGKFSQSRKMILVK